MKERPILFSGPMVRAILEGRKTVTRRALNARALQLIEYGARCDECHPPPVDGDIYPNDASYYAGFCPYGQPGDRLWVREAWQYADWTEEGEPHIGYQADGARIIHEEVPEEWAARLESVWADLSDTANYDIDGRAADRQWRPSIHMPRWASRILLEITAVRVERLQDISEEQARAEGTEPYSVSSLAEDEIELVDAPLKEPGNSYRNGFAMLWESLNGSGSWAANPWVWVVEFKRVTL
jgi:hypothetical protein